VPTWFAKRLLTRRCREPRRHIDLCNVRCLSPEESARDPYIDEFFDRELAVLFSIVQRAGAEPSSRDGIVRME
jgi:hypothetical protein